MQDGKIPRPGVEVFMGIVFKNSKKKKPRHSVVARECKGLLFGDDVVEDRRDHLFEFLQKWDGKFSHLRVGFF